MDNTEKPVIFLHDCFYKDLEKLPGEIQKKVLKSLKDKVRNNPKEYLKKIRNTNYYSHRVGDYRSLCIKNKQEFIFVKVKHRKKIYKKY